MGHIFSLQVPVLIKLWEAYQETYGWIKASLILNPLSSDHKTQKDQKTYFVVFTLKYRHTVYTFSNKVEVISWAMQNRAE